MAKYSIKFEIEVIVDQDFEVGKEGDILYDKDTNLLTDSQYNSILDDAVLSMDMDFSGNVAEVSRVEDDDE